MLTQLSTATSKAHTHKQHIIISGASFLFGCLMALYYWYIIVVVQVPMDIQHHLHYISESMCAKNQSAPANIGFYYVVWLLSGFSCEYEKILKVGIVFLGTCWGAVTYFSVYAGIWLDRWAMSGNSQDRELHSKYIFKNSIVAISSCLIFPIPVFKYYYYLGLLPPNIYFNSTWVGSLPFTIVVFMFSAKQLQLNYKSLKTEMIIGMALVASALFKPSFAFVLVPAYALLRISRTRMQQWYSLLVPLSVSLLPVIVVIIAQTIWITENPQTLLGGKTSFAVSFPAGWIYILPNLPARHMVVRFLCSFAVPIICYTFRPDWLKLVSHQLVLLCTVIGFIIFMLVHEAGERSGHGNFIWQVLSANHLLYWIVILSVVNWRPASRSEFYRRCILLLFIAMHVVSGFTYLMITILHKSYV